MEEIMTMMDCVGGDAVERSTSVNSMTMMCRREKKFFFLLFHVFKKRNFLFFFFESYYKGYSLHDCKLKTNKSAQLDALLGSLIDLIESLK
jgi:hypothetical protein